MIVVQIGKQLIAVAGRQSHIPAVIVGMEIKTHGRFVVFRHNIVSFAVALHQIAAAVIALDLLCTAGHGIVTAPELYAVDHHQVGQSRDLIHGKHPQSEKHKFVDKLVAKTFVPRQQTVGQSEASTHDESERDAAKATATPTVNTFFLINKIRLYSVIKESDGYSGLANIVETHDPRHIVRRFPTAKITIFYDRIIIMGGICQH